MTTAYLTDIHDNSTSGAQVWTGRVLSGVAVLFLAMDATMKVLQAPVALEGTKKLGYPVGVVAVLGIVQLVCLAAYYLAWLCMDEKFRDAAEGRRLRQKMKLDR